MTRLSIALAVVAVMLPGTAMAQQSRADEIAALQAQKAATLKPPAPDKGERIYLLVKGKLLEAPNGWFPTTDTVYSGGGLTLGAGYRHYFADRTFGFVRGMYSIKGYKLAELGTTSPGHAGGRLSFKGVGGWRETTQVRYHGQGMDTTQDDQANFGFEQAYANGAAEARLGAVVLGGGIGFDNYRAKGGSGTAPSIEEVYTPEEAPGLGETINYVHVDATAAIDWRTSPGYSRSGGMYGVGVHRYLDQDDTFSFTSADAEVVQHLPILRETWVLSLRGRLETLLNDDDVTPFFLLPALGGGSSLRGYDGWRFRDRHAVLGSAEVRWFPNRLGLDVAAFFDTGMVAPEIEGLNLKQTQARLRPWLPLPWPGVYAAPHRDRARHRRAAARLRRECGVLAMTLQPRARRLVAPVALLVMATALSGQTPPPARVGRAFYGDDPLAREPETQDAAGAVECEIELAYDLALNLFAASG